MRMLSPHDSVPVEHPIRTRLGLRIAFPCVIAALAHGACVYDPDDRCGEHQVLLESSVHICVCDEQSALTPSGCVPCGAHEVPGAAGCVCEEGYGRADPSEACRRCGDNEVSGAQGCECAPGFGRASAGTDCTALPGELGLECDPTTDDPCADSTFDYCAASHDEDGYCTTQGCTSSDDCLGSYACDLLASPPYCKRPPDGLGKWCMTDDDCADTEATHCDALATNTCLVQGCTLAPDNCFVGFECCDLSSEGVAEPVCVAKGQCTQ